LVIVFASSDSAVVTSALKIAPFLARGDRACKPSHCESPLPGYNSQACSGPEAKNSVERVNWRDTVKLTILAGHLRPVDLARSLPS
jgi:hypothetical protein